MTQPTEADPEEMLTRARAAQVAGISVSTLLRAEAAGKVTTKRTPGGHRRFRRGDVETLLSSREIESTS